MWHSLENPVREEHEPQDMKTDLKDYHKQTLDLMCLKEKKDELQAQNFAHI